MAKTKKQKHNEAGKRPPRAKLSPEESLKRMQDIDKRKEDMIAAVRKNKNRDLPA